MLPVRALRHFAACRAEMTGGALCGLVMAGAALKRTGSVEIGAFAVKPGLAQRMGCLALVAVMA